MSKDLNALHLDGELAADPFDDTEPYPSPAIRIEEEPTFLRGDHVEVSERLEEDLRRTGPIVYTEGSVYQYNDGFGIWVPLSRENLMSRVQAFAGSPVGDKGKSLRISINDQKGAVQSLEARIRDDSFFSEAVQGIAFNNGFVCLIDGCHKFVPNAPDNRARSRYEFNFTFLWQPTQYLQFLKDCFRDDDDCKEKIRCIQEFGGACILGFAWRYNQSLIQYGPSAANGKSQNTRIISSAMPKGTVSAIPPHEFTREYYRAGLAGKRLNTVSELPERDILDAEAIKAVITGDEISARQIYQAEFKFKPIAGHLFSANRLPSVTDTTGGFFRRFLVITYNRSFKNDPAREPGIAERIIDEELPLIVSWFVMGGLRLWKQGKYTEPPSHVAALERWQKSSNKVQLFVEERTRRPALEEPGTSLDELYREYRIWCQKVGLHYLSRPKFTGELEQLGYEKVRTSAANYWPFILNTSTTST